MTLSAPCSGWRKGGGYRHNGRMRANHTLYRDGRRAAAWGLVMSLGLGLVKFLGGLFGGSLALLTDAVNSLADAAVSGALLGALYVAERPADPEHPYGHGRAEAVAGMGVALLLIVVALGIGWEAWISRSEVHPPPATYTLVIAAVCSMIQEGLYRYTSRIARRTGSGALMATSWDYRLDALGGLAVVVGVALARWGGPSWQWADHAAAIAVAAIVLWVGGGLLRQNIDDLIDRQADEDLLEAVRNEACAVPGVREVETLRVRKVGLEYLVDIHIEVDRDKSVESGHAIAHAVKDGLIGRVPAIRDVLVHVEPHVASPQGSDSTQ
jgi:cation diffusion facilitator family transporter